MIEFTRRDLKKKKIMKTFINAVSKIINEEGIERVTIRKVAKIAGYNSATIYNYFDNYNQLVFFAATHFLSDYVQALPKYIKKSKDTLEQFLLIWECFCKYSFEKPQIYYAIFADDIGDRSEDLIKKYYQLFPEELGDPPQELIPMLLETRLSKRCSIHIQPCIESGYFTASKAYEIDETIRLIYHGMLSLLINKRVEYTNEEAVNKIMKHIRRIVYNNIEK